MEVSIDNIYITIVASLQRGHSCTRIRPPAAERCCTISFFRSFSYFFFFCSPNHQSLTTPWLCVCVTSEQTFEKFLRASRGRTRHDRHLPVCCSVCVLATNSASSSISWGRVNILIVMSISECSSSGKFLFRTLKSAKVSSTSFRL